jgi:hypothetical protein
MALFGSFVGLGAALSGPAASWAQKLPGSLPRLQERLTFLSRPIKTLPTFLHQAEGLAQGEQPVGTVAVEASGLNDKVLSATRAIASGLFTTVLVLFFLLISGDIFLRRLVEILPRFKNKDQEVGSNAYAIADAGRPHPVYRFALVDREAGVARRREPDHEFRRVIRRRCGAQDPIEVVVHGLLGRRFIFHACAQTGEVRLLGNKLY